MIVSHSQLATLITGGCISLAAIAYVGRWPSTVFKPTPGQMCSDRQVVDDLTNSIREKALFSERIFADHKAPATGSNGSYAPKAESPEPEIAVVVKGILALDYNDRIDRVKCRMSFQINGADRTNLVGMLEGISPDRSFTYFVQPDANGRFLVSQ